MIKHKIKKRLVIAVVVFVVFYLALYFYSDFSGLPSTGFVVQSPQKVSVCNQQAFSLGEGIEGVVESCEDEHVNST